MKWLLTLLSLSLFAAPAAAKLRVVATVQTLASVVQEVGGDRVEVQALVRGYEDPHFVQAKPSLVLTLNRADALVYVGLELEIGWLPPLVLQSRNPKIRRGQPANVDCSTALPMKIEDLPGVPAEKLRAMGDIHPLGNPHYWIPPANILAIAHLIATRLQTLDPAGADTYRKNEADFAARVRAREAQWRKQAAPLRGAKVVSYHMSWSYVAHWLGLQEVGYIEPKAGVPPTTRHTAQLIALMQKEGVQRVLEESFYPRNLAQLVAEKGGARLVVLPSDVGAEPQIRTYFDLVDAVIAKLR